MYRICQSQVIQQSLGQQVSQPVAQIVAGFAKVFVGEIVEKGMSARQVHVRMIGDLLSTL
jgi:hTAFII28-like protein conserved region